MYNCGLAASRASYLPKKGRAKGRLPASSMVSITPCYMAMLTATYSPSNQIRVEKREGDAHLTYSKRKRLTLHSVCRGETNQNNTVGVFFFWKEEEEENKAGQKRDENRSPKATANPEKGGLSPTHVRDSELVFMLPCNPTPYNWMESTSRDNWRG